MNTKAERKAFQDKCETMITEDLLKLLLKWVNTGDPSWTVGDDFSHGYTLGASRRIKIIKKVLELK